MPTTIILSEPSQTIFEDLIQALAHPGIEVVFCPRLPNLSIQHMEDVERLVRLRDAIESTRAVTLSLPVADAETCVFLFGQENIDPQFIFTLDRKNLAYIPPRISMKLWGHQSSV